MTSQPTQVPPILKQTLERLGFGAPTPVQAGAIAATLEGKDVIALAPTGSGKTLAYGVGVMSRLIADKPKHSTVGERGAKRVDPGDRLRALVLCPTRELAQQVAKDLSTASKGTVLRICAVYGKSAIRPQREAIASGVDLVAGTPGRILELMQEGSLPTAALKVVVIDEADRMVDMGFFPQVSRVLERVPAARQVLCFSATLPPQVEESVASIVRDPVRVEVGRRNAAVQGDHRCYHIEDEQKVALLLWLLKRGGVRGAVVYVRTRRRVGWVAGALKHHGLSVEVMHGDRSQARRNEAMARFAAGEAAVLVATDVAARGLHVPAIKWVINYDAPMMPEDFIHRVGRSGHGLGRSSSISFMAASDKQRLHSALELAGFRLDEPALPEIQEFARPGLSPAPDREDAPRSARKGPAIRDPHTHSSRKGPTTREPRLESEATAHEVAPKRRTRRRSRVDRSSSAGVNVGVTRFRGKEKNKPLGTQKPGGGVKRAQG